MNPTYPEPPRENAPILDSTEQATTIWISPVTNPITPVRGATIERFPFADLLDANLNVVRSGGTFTLVSPLPKPPNVTVQTQPGVLMNGYVKVENVTTNITVVCQFTPHPPYSHLTGRYTLNIQPR